MSRSTRNGLTLIELLAVIAIVGISIALLVPATRRVRDSAARMQTLNNLRSLAIANHGYNDAHKRLPPAQGGSVAINGTIYKENTTCVFVVGPYLETNASSMLNPSDYSFTAAQGSWTSGVCYTSLAANLYVFSDPDNGIAGTNTPLSISEIPDGTSNTIMLATTMAMCGGRPVLIQNGNVLPFFGYDQKEGWQVAPPAGNCVASTGSMAASYTTAAIQIALCDASSRNLMTNTSFWAKLLTPKGTEHFEWDQ